MSSTTLASRRSYGALLSRLVWPTALLLGITILFGFATILWTSHSANLEAAARQRVQLGAALEQTLQDLRAQLNRLVEAPDGMRAVALTGAPEMAFQIFSQRAAPQVGATAIFRVSPTDGRVLSSMVENTAEAPGAFERQQDLVLAIVEQARAELLAAETAGAAARIDSVVTCPAKSRLLTVGGGIFGLVAQPMQVDGRSEIYVAVGLKELTDGALARVAGLHGLDAFAVVPELPEGLIGLPVDDGAGRTGAYLAWSPDRPGDAMRWRLLPLTLACALVTVSLFVVVVLHTRRIADDLHATQEQAQTLVGRDPLSGLPNRLLFAERLDQELARLERDGVGLAVLFLDLDRFKDVNDTYGHQAGDELIKLVAKRLDYLLRAQDTLARFGGDEFAVIQTRVSDRADAESLCRRILTDLGQPFEINGATISIGASIGVALAPEHGTVRETLMRLADTALYQAKSEGRNRYSLFQAQMDETIRMRKVVGDDLREAIQKDQLTLHYQPIYSADGETVVALEALVRWPHPVQGLISPARFIPMAEERGLIIPLGEWVLRRACQDGKRWPGVRIAVNVSPIQFRHRDYVASVMQALQATGFEASRLELELTEGVVVEDADAAEAAMMELRALGVNLALDDFGTGYSSLIYLRRFAFDKIKIDRSFLESMEATGESAILVHSIVHLGRALGLTVTAEGVETREQHRFLQALGCHQLQGYLFSRPVPAEEIDALLLGRTAPSRTGTAA